MFFHSFHPYVYYATRYPFYPNQSSALRICYTSSLYLISDGKGILKLGEQTYETDKGALVFIPAGVHHEWIADVTDPMVHVCCYFDWSYVERAGFFSHPAAICYEWDKLQSPLVGPIFPHTIPPYTKVENLRMWIRIFEGFYTVNVYTNERTFMRNLKVQSRFQEFIEFFLTQALIEGEIPDPRIFQMLDRMEQDMVHGRILPLEHYYGGLRLSRGYFFELFKKATGLAPLQYINRFRINRAMDDLRFSELSVTQIAQKHHFTSVHYFSRLFHQVAGQTPREFREHENDRPTRH